MQIASFFGTVISSLNTALLETILYSISITMQHMVINVHTCKNHSHRNKGRDWTLNFSKNFCMTIINTMQLVYTCQCNLFILQNLKIMVYIDNNTQRKIQIQRACEVAKSVYSILFYSSDSAHFPKTTTTAPGDEMSSPHPRMVPVVSLDTLFLA